jgi:hypothetical protein
MAPISSTPALGNVDTLDERRFEQESTARTANWAYASVKWQPENAEWRLLDGLIR